MPSHHDLVFKDLLTDRAFAVSFLNQYMPAELAKMVWWDSVQLLSGNSEHVRPQEHENLKQKEMSDLNFLFKLKDGSEGLAFVHIEAQMSNDASILLRTQLYQLSHLLDYAKRNNCYKKLPLVCSIIYYSNERTFSHSMDIFDYFENTELARKYALTTQLVDLNNYRDEELAKHGRISGYEILLKAIAHNAVDNKIPVLVDFLTQYTSRERRVLIRYMARHSEVEPRNFCDILVERDPNLEEDVMSVAEQWVEAGRQEGIQKGIQKGRQEGMIESAKTLIASGEMSESKVIHLFGLSPEDLK